MFDRGNDQSVCSETARPGGVAGRPGRSPAVTVRRDAAAPDAAPAIILDDRAEHLAGDGIAVLARPAAPLSPYVASWRKRALDLVIGVPLALAVVPVVLVLALAALVSLRSWPFFVQNRVGRGGRLFRMIKIRTLPRQAPRYASKYELGSVGTSRVGQWMRRTHVDELPQLFLVVIGSMSLVGPRPEMAQLMDRFDAAEADLRVQVRPGCTGLWQVSEDAGKLIHEVPQYDRAYLKSARLSLDLFLLWTTVCVAMRSESPGYFVHLFRTRFGCDI